MGNWRTVRIVGTCDEREVAELRRAIIPGKNYEGMHCLSFCGGLAGLPDWGKSEFDCVGNLAERDYSVQDAADALQKIASKVPSLKVKIHCGGEYESKDCVNTITLEGGMVTIGEPEVAEIGEIPEGQVVKNFYSQVMRKHFGQ